MPQKAIAMGLLIAAGSPQALAHPSEDLCLWGGKEYSLEARFCIAKDHAVVCVKEGDKPAQWRLEETQDLCPEQPRLP